MCVQSVSSVTRVAAASGFYYTMCVKFPHLCCLRSTTVHFSPLPLPTVGFLWAMGVILPLLVFYLFSLGGPRGAGRSPRWPLAHGQRPSELPSQLRPSVPPPSAAALRLLASWRSHVDLLPLARTLSKEPPFPGPGIIYLGHIWQRRHLGPL